MTVQKVVLKCGIHDDDHLVWAQQFVDNVCQYPELMAYLARFEAGNMAEIEAVALMCHDPVQAKYHHLLSAILDSVPRHHPALVKLAEEVIEDFRKSINSDRNLFTITEVKGKYSIIKWDFPDHESVVTEERMYDSNTVPSPEAYYLHHHPEKG